MLPMLPSLGRVWEESEAVTDSVPVPSWKGMGKLRNHLRNGASRTQYLEVSDTEPAGTCSSMNTVNIYNHIHSLLFQTDIYPQLLTLQDHIIHCDDTLVPTVDHMHVQTT